MATHRQLTFDDAFVTGVEEIDSQHRNLIDLTNEASALFARGPTPKQVRHVVQELLSYAIYHFRTEESLMQEYRYNDGDAAAADAHVRAHRGFAAKVVATQEALENREYVDFEQLIDFLADWITRHIMGTDQKLAGFILQRRAGQAGGKAIG